ncbi:MAG: OmpH family outer membrane protein [Fimbriimonadaceae bacterium]|nr:OmpH family outer membrane protein [Fimbriimonadaceae bacterium]
MKSINHRQSRAWLGAFAALAVLMAAFMFGSGFQANNEKFASVDITKVLDQSKLGQQSNDSLRAAFSTRSDLLTFATENLCMTQEQGQTLLTLGLKDTLTAAEKTQFDTTKAAVQNATRQRMTLAQKTNLTEEEKTLLADLNQRAQTGMAVVQQWNSQFNNDMDALGQKLRDDAVTKVRQVISTEAKRQGYTLVFESSVLVYSANDLTADVIKAVDASSP